MNTDGVDRVLTSIGSGEMDLMFILQWVVREIEQIKLHL